MQHCDGKNNAGTKLCRGKVHADILSGQACQNMHKANSVEVLAI